jgi:hypothetical protein
VATDEMSPTPAASPSRPSTKLIALTIVTTSSTVRIAPWFWSRISSEPPAPLPPHGTQKMIHCSPSSTRMPAQVV